MILTEHIQLTFTFCNDWSLIDLTGRMLSLPCFYLLLLFTKQYLVSDGARGSWYPEVSLTFQPRYIFYVRKKKSHNAPPYKIVIKKYLNLLSQFNWRVELLVTPLFVVNEWLQVQPMTAAQNDKCFKQYAGCVSRVSGRKLSLHFINQVLIVTVISVVGEKGFNKPR